MRTMTVRGKKPEASTSSIRKIVGGAATALLTLIALILLAAPCAQAQFDTASVLGTIKDPSGAGIASASVTLLSPAKGVSVTRQTDANGNYEFTNVQPGEYSISVTAANFEKEDTGQFTVTVGARQRVELTLRIGTDAQTVQVSGAASLLETDTSDRGETVGTQEAVNLPLNGRAYADLSTLVPGVRESLLEVLSLPSRDASYNVNGLNSMVNNFQLDGIDNNAYQSANQGYSNEAIVPSPDAIQEFKVETDNYSAEYGRAGGAIINATIRSGTNQFHGVAYDYLRNTVLNAYGPFIGTGVKPTLVQNQFGGTLGGPVKRDKLFFFGDYEGLRNVNRAIQTAVVPTAAQAQGIFTDAQGNPIPLQNPITGAQYPEWRDPGLRPESVRGQRIEHPAGGCGPQPKRRGGWKQLRLHPCQHRDREQGRWPHGRLHQPAVDSLCTLQPGLVGLFSGPQHSRVGWRQQQRHVVCVYQANRRRL